MTTFRNMSENDSLIPTERIERSILLIRGEKVMLDLDLGRFMGFRRRLSIRRSNETLLGFQRILCFGYQPKMFRN